MSTEWYFNVIRGKLHGCNPNVRELWKGNMQVFFTGVEKGNLSKHQETISRWRGMGWGWGGCRFQYNILSVICITVLHYIFEWADKKKNPKNDLMVFLFVVIQMSMKSPQFGLQFCLKLPQGLYYMSADSKGSGGTVLMCRLA